MTAQSHLIGNQYHLKHGHCRTAVGKESPTYSSWHAMMKRCTHVNSAIYARYGALGITVCDRWRTFAAFLEDMGVRPAGTSLDRIDNERGYEPGNCRWATPLEQAANRRPRKRTPDSLS